MGFTIGKWGDNVRTNDWGYSGDLWDIEPIGLCA